MYNEPWSGLLHMKSAFVVHVLEFEALIVTVVTSYHTVTMTTVWN